MDVEEFSAGGDAMVTLDIDLTVGLQAYMVADALCKLGLSERPFVAVVQESWTTA
jgi:succinyl-CoA synthetase beta subunit